MIRRLLFVSLLVTLLASCATQSRRQVQTTTTCNGSHENGLRHGTWECFYENGQMHSRMNFAFGKREGLSEFWKIDGTLDTSADFKNGHLDGWQRTYYPNGQVDVETQYRAGRQHGIARGFTSDGTKIFEATYRDGKRHGWYREWHPNGKPKYEQEFADDKELREEKSWPPQ